MSSQRSSQWYAGDDRNAYIHRAWMRRGLPGHAFDGRPHIAVANTASDLTPCNAHLNEVAESVKQGVYEAGGIPMNLPVVSLGETQVRPTAMLWRNMAAMAAEELFRANPIDGLVLLGGCDKTIPALLMAAASVNLPAVVVPGGPMLSGTFRGVALGCGTDVWKLSEEVRAGTVSQQDFLRSESSMIRSRGHCNTMGTASTMALMADALGTTIPGVAGTPAADSRQLEAAHETGRLAIAMVREGRRPSELLSRGSFLNAIVALAAVGGSTNAVIHLLAIAGRRGIELTQDDFDRAGASVPLLVDLQPAGRFLMEDLHRAGGLLAVLREVRDLLDPSAMTVTGRPLVDYLGDARIWDPEVIRQRSEPLQPQAGIAVLYGSLAPTGAMVRICDGRMSGTAYETVVLHVSPEAAAGGPLGRIRTGDYVTLDVPARRLEVAAQELAARAPAPAAMQAYAKPSRGRESLYVSTVQQANTGADLDFLVGASGDQVSRDSH